MDIFHQAWNNSSYECFLKPDTRLPMMYIDDCLRSMVEIMEAPEECLAQRTYNIHAMDFTPEELTASIKKYVPNLKVTYKPDSRQDIGKHCLSLLLLSLTIIFFPIPADTWPRALDDTHARRDWNWTHYYDMNRLCEAMFAKLAQIKEPSSFVSQEVLIDATRSMEQMKYDSTNDERLVHMSN